MVRALILRDVLNFVPRAESISDPWPHNRDRFVEHGTVALYQISLAILEYYQEPLLGLAYEDLIRFFNPLEALPPGT